ncbi:threonine/serine dehydratase [Caldilinea sp.]|uniref:threonine/serine dehydratase n=1 Tax=Caldilinea sp. TaxID=2293560 RepID=UPI0021DC66F8|nr:threonine/serine dehydratase [Caldilinea sp.]GIV70795.1 MAG: serine/threonine dehydratase [Caldilinea sp.]
MVALKQAILEAGQRIRPYVRRTPLDESIALSEMGGDRVFLKLENLQYTGSFKLRGATNKLLSLSPETLARGVVAASSGNHGAAVAYALRRLGVKGVVFVPECAAATKVEAIQRYGAEVRRWGMDSVEAEQQARAFAAQSGRAYISPYNDWEIVAGQGTIGLEVLEELPDVETLYVTVGGGGLIGGIAGYIKALDAGRSVRIVGCLPAHSPVMYESVRAGRIVQMESLPTLSDGSAGGIEEDAITFALCQQLVDDWMLVTEAEIADAVRLIARTHHLMVEGAAGVAVAAYLKDAQRGRGRNVAIVLCGANIDLDVLKTIL